MSEYYEPLRYVVQPAEDGWKLRTILQAKMLISRQLLVRLKQTEQGILLNGERKYVDFYVRPGDVVEVRMPVEQSDDILPQAMPLDIVHEDEDVMVLNKPPGLIVHPTHGHYINTLANGVVYDWLQRGVRCRFRPVQRLDRDTSGLLLVAKTPFAHQFVSLQLREHTVKKEYLAIVCGQVQNDFGTIDAPIDRLPENPHRRAVLAGGAAAVTHYEVVERFKTVTLVRLRLMTGRTHQIRVHMEYLGHPLLADELYGPVRTEHESATPPHTWITRQALHAQTLAFVHPGTRRNVEFQAPLPADMANCLESARAART